MHALEICMFANNFACKDFAKSLHRSIKCNENWRVARVWGLIGVMCDCEGRKKSSLKWDHCFHKYDNKTWNRMLHDGDFKKNSKDTVSSNPNSVQSHNVILLFSGQGPKSRQESGQLFFTSEIYDTQDKTELSYLVCHNSKPELGFMG